MIRLTIQDDKVTCVADSVDRINVYLDNDSLTELARKDDGLRERFLTALHRRGTFLFSWTNVLQVSSCSRVQSFLDAIGPHWIPLAMNAWEVSRLEKAGRGREASVPDTFLKAYFQARASELSPNGSKILDLSDAFFQLGAVIKWSLQKRNDMISWRDRSDDTLRGIVAAYASNPQGLDRDFPAIPFDDRWPVSFVSHHLLRILAHEAKRFHLKYGDGPDFCHAVMAVAHAQVAALDKHWKRRVEQIPPPHRLAQVFYKPQIAELVSRFEALVMEAD